MKKSELKEAIKNEIKSILSEDMNPKIYELRSQRVKATIDDLNQYLQNNVTASGLKDTLQDMIKFLDQFIFDDSLNENINEESRFPTQADIDDIENSGNIDIAYDKAMKLLKSLMNKSVSFSDVREDRNKQLVGLELVQFLMDRFNMSEDEALKSLADNIGNVKHEEKDKIRESEEMTDTEMNAKSEKEAKEADKKAKKEEKELKLKVDKIKSILKKNQTDISRIAKLPRNKRTKADDEMFDSMVSKTKELKKLEKDLK